MGKNGGIGLLFDFERHALTAGQAADFVTHAHARADIFDYLEAFYNRERLHSALNFLSPAAFEHQTN